MQSDVVVPVLCPLFANSRRRRRLLSLNTCAAQLVGLVLGWCWGHCRTFVEYGPVRLVLPSTAPGFVFEYGRAAPSPARRVADGMLRSFSAALMLHWFGTQPPGSQPPPSVGDLRMFWPGSRVEDRAAPPAGALDVGQVVRSLVSGWRWTRVTGCGWCSNGSCCGHVRRAGGRGGWRLCTA